MREQSKLSAVSATLNKAVSETAIGCLHLKKDRDALSLPLSFYPSRKEVIKSWLARAVHQQEKGNVSIQ